MKTKSEANKNYRRFYNKKKMRDSKKRVNKLLGY